MGRRGLASATKQSDRNRKNTVVDRSPPRSLRPAESIHQGLQSGHAYVGTAAADEDEASLAPSLYEMAGLDPKAWTILGIDLSIVDNTETVVVYAFDRTAHGIQSHKQLLDLAHQAGELPATSFTLSIAHPPDAAVFTLLDHLTVRLIIPALQNKQVIVTAHREAPITAMATSLSPPQQ